MCTVTFHFRPSVRRGHHPGSIFIRAIHCRRSGSVTTPYRLFPEEWDARGGQVILPAADSARYGTLAEIAQGMERDRAYLADLIAKLEQRGECCVKTVLEHYRNRERRNLLLVFTERLCRTLEEAGQERTARAYRTAARRLMLFTGNPGMSLEQITCGLIKRFEEHLKNEGSRLNTVSFYMRNLRAIYNKAVREMVVPPRLDHPFAGVYTGVQVTRKRALSRQGMVRLNRFDTSLTEDAASGQPVPAVLPEELRHALALFLFGFHARGMSFVDMAYLRKENIQRGVISYFRKKTGQQLEIKLTPTLRRLLAYFAPKSAASPYVFPIIRPGRGPERLQYESALRLQNYRLRRLARLAGIDKNITTHVARHSWATIAKQENLPLWVISEALGHSNEKTTYIYLGSFERSVIDKANEKIARAVKKAVG